MIPSPTLPARRAGNWLRRAGVVAALAAAGAAPARADVITFDAQRGLVGHNDSFAFDALLVRALSPVAGADDGALVGAFIDGSDADSCVNLLCAAGDASIYYAALDGSYLRLSTRAAGGVRLDGFDAAFLGQAGQDATAGAPGLIEIDGLRADGSVVVERFLLGAAGVDGYPFRAIRPSAAFSTTAFVDVTIFGYACAPDTGCTAFPSDRAQFALDNVSLVPEPGAAGMLGLGLAGLLGVYGRRAASLNRKEPS
jgi:hypothetical protein